MLKIKREFFKEMDTIVDYELEDGTKLYEDEWNGEVYTVKEGKEEKTYRPVYKDFYDEDGDFDYSDIIGFEK